MRAHKTLEQQLEPVTQFADGLILAGDITNDAIERVEVLEYLSTVYKDLIFVLGNHDYVGSDMLTNDLENQLSNLKPNVRLLNNSSLQVNGKTIHGGTLWYPRSHMANVYKSRFFDFRVTKNGDPEIFNRHQVTLKYLKESVKPGDIVVTHHAPCTQSIHPDFEGEDTNCFFIVDLDKEIKELKPSLWIHGHVHNHFDYTFGDTRVLCNPYGYDSEVGRNGYVPTFIEI